MAAESEPEARLTLPVDVSLTGLFEAAGLTVTASRPRLRTLELVDTAGCRLAATGGDLRAGPGDVWTWRRDPLGHPKLPAAQQWSTAGTGAAARAAAWSRGFARGHRLERRIPVRSYRRDHRVSTATGEALLTIAEERLDERGQDGWTPRHRSATVSVVDQGRRGAAALSLLGDAALSGHGVPMALLRPRLVRPPVLRVADAGGGAGAHDLLQRSLVLSALQWLHFDAELRGDGSADAIRKVRVALRRIRSDLLTFRPLLERPWADGIRADLASLATDIGRARDIEVRRERLLAMASHLPVGDQADAAALAALAGADHDDSLAHLRDLLDRAPYLASLERTIAAVAAPRWLTSGDTPSVAALVDRPWRRLHRFVGGLPEAPTDEELHRIRILAKRARYAADAAVPAHPAAAVNVVALAAVQTVLGEHHDAAVNREWLRAVAGDHPELGFVAGELAALEQRTMDDAAATWVTSWRAAARRRDWRWLRD